MGCPYSATHRMKDNRWVPAARRTHPTLGGC
jgi:hypothetical protein